MRFDTLADLGQTSAEQVPGRPGALRKARSDGYLEPFMLIAYPDHEAGQIGSGSFSSPKKDRQITWLGEDDARFPGVLEGPLNLAR